MVAVQIPNTCWSNQNSFYIKIPTKFGLLPLFLHKYDCILLGILGILRQIPIVTMCLTHSNNLLVNRTMHIGY